MDIPGPVVLACVLLSPTARVVGSPVLVHRFAGLPLTVSLLIVSVLWLAFATSTARADAFTDRFQANTRDVLQKPYHKAPFPCSAGWSSGKDNYVLDVTPWAAASGLRRGDHLVAYGGIPLTGTEDSDEEVWARVPRGEYVDIRVDRAGKEVSIRLPCRDDRQKWEARVALGQAIAEGRWQDCVDAVSRWVRIAGYAPSGILHTAVLCMLEKAKAEKQRPPDEYWRRLHAWATKAIEEAHYRPTGLAEIRGRLLAATEALEKAGRNTLADDIKQQIATFNQTPPGTGGRADFRQHGDPQCPQRTRSSHSAFLILMSPSSASPSRSRFVSGADPGASRSESAPG